MSIAFTGAILTGGSSSRMGRDKSLLLIDGRPMVSIVATALHDACASEVIAIGGDNVGLEAIAEIDRFVIDLHPGEGPLGGILSALEASSDDVVVVLACDTPAITADTPRLLVRALESDPTLACTYAFANGREQPLTAAWRRDLAAEPIRRAFDKGERAPRSLLHTLSSRAVTEIDASSVLDVDRPEDLRRYAHREPTRSDGP